jgi:peptidoglycan/LPS O-acetylase OafA/YrhL
VTAPVDTPVRRPRVVVEPDVPAWLLDRPRGRPAPPRVLRPVQTVALAADREPAVEPAVDYVLPPLPEVPVPRPEPRLRFRPDVDGLRGVAVLLVVLYHAELPWLRGGFIGVDAFFVLSGYLVTALLVEEVRRDDTVGLAAFYARRCRRILPAAGVVLTATCALGAVLLPPLARLDLARDVLASALYGGNWRFVAVRPDHLRTGADSPVLHLWSLGVGGQFYLLWPVLFVVALLVAGRLQVARTTVLAVALTALTIGSFVLSLHWTQTSAPLAYLSSPSRGWQFAAGAWMALLLPVVARLGGRTARGVRLTVGVAGLAVLCWAAAALRTQDYPGTAALVPTAATVALIAAGCDLPHRRATGASRLLSWAPLVALGQVSFTWYLWHWPVIAFVAAWAGDVPWPVRLAVALASLGPAVLTARWVERPLRRSPVVSSRPRVGLALGVVATVVPVCAALVLGAVTVARLDGSAPTYSAAGRIDRGVVHFDDTLTSGPVEPSVLTAARDAPSSPEGCLVPATGDASPACVTGIVGPGGPVVLFGDSHAEQWLPAVEVLARGMGTGVVQLTKQGCPAAALTVGVPNGGTYAACDRWRESSLRRLEAGARPALVLVSSYNGYAGDLQRQADAWEPTLRRLVGLGAPVVYVADTPVPRFDVPTCVFGALNDWSRCAFDRGPATRDDLVAGAVAAGLRPGVHLVDLDPFVCPAPFAGARCPAVRGGILLYRDGSHLTDTAVRRLAPQFVAAVRAQIDR